MHVNAWGRKVGGEEVLVFLEIPGAIARIVKRTGVPVDGAFDVGPTVVGELELFRVFSDMLEPAAHDEAQEHRLHRGVRRQRLVVAFLDVLCRECLESELASQDQENATLLFLVTPLHGAHLVHFRPDQMCRVDITD